MITPAPPREPGDDGADYVTILQHRHGKYFVALMRYNLTADSFEPVRSSFKVQSRKTIEDLARQWAKMYGVEYRP